MSQLKVSDIKIGDKVAYQRGNNFSLATVIEIKNRIKIRNEGEERWVTASGLHPLDKLKPNSAKANYSEALLQALAAMPRPEPVAEPAPPPLKAVTAPLPEAVTEDKGAEKSEPPVSLEKTPPKKPPRPPKPKPPVAVTPPPVMGWSPRLIAVITLVVLMLLVGLFLYFNRSQLEHLTMTPTAIPIK